MKITFLGTGTSSGVPMIGCDCPVCCSTDPRNKRTRSSVYLENNEGLSLLIDASVDLREQALRENIVDVRHILLTHIHADHVFGLNEIRVFNQRNKTVVDLYLNKETDREIRDVFRYIYMPPLQQGGGLPHINNNVITPGKSFKIYNFTITPFVVLHGHLPILAFRIDDFVYITDASVIPAESYCYLKDVEVLVLNVLRERKHPTHFSLEEALVEVTKIGAGKTYFTHLAHDLDHQALLDLLPANVEPAYDGLTLLI